MGTPHQLNCPLSWEEGAIDDGPLAPPSCGGGRQRLLGGEGLFRHWNQEGGEGWGVLGGGGRVFGHWKWEEVLGGGGGVFGHWRWEGVLGRLGGRLGSQSLGSLRRRRRASGGDEQSL